MGKGRYSRVPLKIGKFQVHDLIHAFSAAKKQDLPDEQVQFPIGGEMFSRRYESLLAMVDINGFKIVDNEVFNAEIAQKVR